MLMRAMANTVDGQDLHGVVERMINLGRYHAVREGVPKAEVDDCEMTFVERMLLRGTEEPVLAGMVESDAWLHRCAKNHARNYRRNTLRQQHRYVSLCAMRHQATRDHEVVDKQTPERVLLRRHVQSSISSVVERLMPEVRAMLLRHYLDGQSAAEIAASSGRSLHAVEQVLYRARITVRMELTRKGVIPADGLSMIE